MGSLHRYDNIGNGLGSGREDDSIQHCDCPNNKWNPVDIVYGFDFAVHHLKRRHVLCCNLYSNRGYHTWYYIPGLVYGVENETTWYRECNRHCHYGIPADIHNIPTLHI